MASKDTRPPVKVIATDRGYDGIQIREVGDTFLVAASVFDKRPRITVVDGEEKQNGFYEDPSWFERCVDEVVAETRSVPASQATNDLA